MPTITFRLSEADKAELEAKARIASMNLSDYIRFAVGVHVADPAERLERLEAHVYDGIERRLAALEELARQH
jgi:hypothetical protein